MARLSSIGGHDTGSKDHRGKLFVLSLLVEELLCTLWTPRLCLVHLVQKLNILYEHINTANHATVSFQVMSWSLEASYYQLFCGGKRGLVNTRELCTMFLESVKFMTVLQYNIPEMLSSASLPSCLNTLRPLCVCCPLLWPFDTSLNPRFRILRWNDVYYVACISTPCSRGPGLSTNPTAVAASTAFCGSRHVSRRLWRPFRAPLSVSS